MNKKITLTNDTFQDLATLAGITWESGKKYFIQADNRIMLCYKDTQPAEDEGFLVPDNQLVEYEHDTGKLYVKIYSVSPTKLNIAD